MFSTLSKKSLAKASVFKNTPIYVQFYITARCNLACQQCNIIYANSDLKEASILEIEKIAENLAQLGTAIVLLTGGEPFIRSDLPQIIFAFESRGIHVRMQTNGFATEKQIEACVEAGGKDISISLDSLSPVAQDKINGGFDASWHKAIRTISNFTKFLPKKNSFGSLGCVLQKDNFSDIKDVIEFGSKIGWYTSVVPVHTTSLTKPRGFRTFDTKQDFDANQHSDLLNLIHSIKKMKKEGHLLYDSDQYLDDILRFATKQPTTWRQKNKGVCDSPNLYFAILPNGNIAPCCDFRIPTQIAVQDKNFVKNFKKRLVHQEIEKVTKTCEGCMYGSYPEISISMRYLAAKLQRIGIFFSQPSIKPWPMSYEEMTEIAYKISNR